MNESEIQWLREQFIRCRPWIQAALDRDFLTHTADDVWKLIENGSAQLWPTPNAVMVTNVEEYPQIKILRGWLAGGNLDEIVATEPKIRDWAIQQGCELVLIVGRRGWVRAFPGYTETNSVIVRRTG